MSKKDTKPGSAAVTAAAMIGAYRRELVKLTEEIRELQRRVAMYAERPQNVRHVHEPLPKPYHVRLRITHPNGQSTAWTLTERDNYVIPPHLIDYPQRIEKPRRWWQRKTFTLTKPEPTVITAEEIR